MDELMMMLLSRKLNLNADFNTMYYMGGSDPPMGRGKFWGENGHRIVKYRDFLPCSVQIG